MAKELTLKEKWEIDSDLIEIINPPEDKKDKEKESNVKA